ncbi:MAG: hypothetical protein ACE5KH_00720 [Candidatus Geothermarchaeales archaeon]
MCDCKYVVEMGTITLSVDDDVEEEFRAVVKETSSRKKGVLGEAVTEAMRLWIHRKKQRRTAEEALKLLDRGFDMGERVYVEREELHR